MSPTKGIRLDPKLREEFERHCRDHLLDERSVIEAWLLRFLEASVTEREAAAKRYQQWRSAGGGPNAISPKSGRKRPGLPS